MLKPVCEATLLEEGILTKEHIRNYALNKASLEFVLKVYAMCTYQPYIYNVHGTFKKTTEYYLTDYGLEYVYAYIKSKNLDFLRKTFYTSFIRATDYDIQHPETYSRIDNFRGTTGYKGVRGTQQKAMVIQTVNKAKRVYNFNSINEAREFLANCFRIYPVDQFKIYRIRTKEGKGTWKEEIPLIIKRKEDVPWAVRNRSKNQNQ